MGTDNIILSGCFSNEAARVQFRNSDRPEPKSLSPRRSRWPQATLRARRNSKK